MYSIAQQAVPKGNGQSEFLRAQLAISLTLVVKKLSPTADSIAILYSFSRAVVVGGRIDLWKVIVVIQARLKSYRREEGESN
jgi:hypothetical protein